MASIQCQKPEEKTCCPQQGHQKHSFGQKMSEMASSIFKGNGSHHHSQGQTTECYSQTQGHCTSAQKSGQASGAMAPCQGKSKPKRRGDQDKKRLGLIQKIKDSVSSDSSSSSDSESDDEKCGTRKN